MAPSRIGFVKLVRLSTRSFFENGGPTTAAAIAYFTLITLFPAFLLLMMLADALLGGAAHQQSAIQMVTLLPVETQPLIRQTLEKLAEPPSWAYAVPNASILLWAGLWVFHLIEEALDRAWNVPRRSSFWRRKLVGLGMVATSGVCLFLAAALYTLIHFWKARLVSMGGAFGSALSGVLLGAGAYLVTAFMFTVIYKVVPNAKVCLSEAVRGGLITSLIWYVVNAAFVWTIPYFDYQRVYGSIWAVVVIIVWIYVSCWILLIGAHLTYYIHRFSE